MSKVPGVRKSDDESRKSLSQDLNKHHFSFLLQEIRQRQRFPEIYSYLRLFTSVSLSKLAGFLDVNEEQCLALLLSLQSKSASLRWKGVSPSLEVNFGINKDVIIVEEHKRVRRHGEFFLQKIVRFEHMIK